MFMTNVSTPVEISYQDWTTFVQRHNTQYFENEPSYSRPLDLQYQRQNTTVFWETGSDF